MRILILGAGAIGGVTAAYLQQNGYDVTLLCNRATTAETICSSGLQISGCRGQQQVVLPAVSSVAELSGSYDYILFAMKAYDLAEAAQSVLPYLAADGLAVSLQNGICYEALQEVVGLERLAVAIVTFSSTMHADAQLEITAEGGFVLGRIDGRCNEQLAQLAKALQTVGQTRLTDNIFGEMYTKLIINSCITCSGAMSGQGLGQLLRSRTARQLFIEIVREDMALAKALGLQVPAFGGKLDYQKFVSGTGLFASLRRHLTLLAVGQKYRRLTSSSLTALQRGKRTEMPFQNGWISRKGQELGVPTPVNDQVVRIITEIEAGQRSIDPANIALALAKQNTHAKE